MPKSPANRGRLRRSAAGEALAHAGGKKLPRPGRNGRSHCGARPRDQPTTGAPAITDKSRPQLVTITWPSLISEWAIAIRSTAAAAELDFGLVPISILTSMAALSFAFWAIVVEDSPRYKHAPATTGAAKTRDRLSRDSTQEGLEQGGPAEMRGSTPSARFHRIDKNSLRPRCCPLLLQVR